MGIRKAELLWRSGPLGITLREHPALAVKGTRQRSHTFRWHQGQFMIVSPVN